MSLMIATAKIVTMSVYTVLEGEHSEIDMLFKALEVSPNIQTVRKPMFARLCHELRTHTVVEQRTVYDRIKNQDSQSKTIAHAEHEHQNMDHLLNELETMNIADDAWMIKLSELRQVVNHHVREEESKMFDRMRLLFTDEEARQMADDFQTQKNAELKKLKRGFKRHRQALA